MVNLLKLKNIIFGFLILSLLFLFSVSLAFAQKLEEPTDFVLTPLSSCAIELEWTGNEDNYRVERGDPNSDRIYQEKDISYTTVIDDETDPPTHTNTFVDRHDTTLWEGSGEEFDIDPGTSFQYRIRAYDPVSPNNSSDWNQPESATTLSLPDKPGSPVSLESVVNSDNGNIEILWATSTVSNLFYPYGGFDIYLETSTDGGDNYSSPTLLSSTSTWGGWVDDGKHFYNISDNNQDTTYRYTIYTREVGGLGCDFYNSNHSDLSDSSTITVPARPSGFSGAASNNPERKITLTWNDEQNSPNETNFEIEKSLNADFTGNVATIPDVSTDTEIYEDYNVEQNQTESYYYRIRSCIDSTCSFWSYLPDNDPVTLGIPVPENLSANIMYATTTHADIIIDWTENGVVGDFVLERATSSKEFVEIYRTGPFRSLEGSYSDTDLELGEEYYYRVKIETDNNESAYSTEVLADLKLAYILHGVGWSATENPSSLGVAGYSGSGWVKLNSDPDNGTGADSEEYVVVVNEVENDIGQITGSAWTDNFGWLSFYEEDLAGCPSGTCTAQVDMETGELSGWARFIAAPEAEEEDSNPFSWNGWVSLSGSAPSYGASLNLASASEGVVPIEGQAWGGPMVGWMDFGSDQCENDTCTARALNLGEPPVVEANPGDNDEGVGHIGLVNNEHGHHDVAYASDPEGDMESYNWEFVECRGPEIDGAEFECPQIDDNKSGTIPDSLGEEERHYFDPGPTYTPEEAGFYTLRLTVEDYFGNEGSDETIEEMRNIPPEVFAGEPHTLSAEELHAHDDDHEDDGPYAEDENGDLVSYEWSWVECFDYDGDSIDPCPELSNDSGTFSESIGPGQRVTVQGPEYTSPPGGRTFELELTVEDSFGNVSTDDVTEFIPECSDGIDNEGDGLVDMDDPDCQNGNDDGESAEGFDEFEFFFEEQ